MELKEINYRERIINLFGEIDEETVKDVINRIVQLNVKDAEYAYAAQAVIGNIGFNVDLNMINLPPITINMSTYGGCIYDGFALCDSIRMSNTPVKIICYGKIMSMGLPILLSAHYKSAHKNTTFMIHGASFGSIGKVEDVKESLDEANRIQNMMIDYICENSKFPRKKLLSIIEKKQDYYFGTEEALKYKIIDEIIGQENK